MTEYRKAVIGDLPELLKVRTDFLLEGYDNVPNEEKLRIYEANKEFLTESLADGSFIEWLAVENGEIIATSSVSFYKLPPNSGLPNGKTAYIGNIFTYKKYRNRGIGTKMLELAVNEAKLAGCAKITLHASDMGKPLYQKFGFEDAKNYMSYRF